MEGSWGNGTELRLLTPGLAPAWSPDGERIAFERRVDGVRCLFAVNVDGSNPTQLTRGPSDDRAPAWSHDGARIFFESDRVETWDLYVMDADGSNVRRVTRQALAAAD